MIYDNHSETTYCSELDKLDVDKVLLSPENKGFGHGHNKAFDVCPQADYHLILNPDVIIHDNSLEILVEQLKAHQDIALIVPKILNTDGTIQHLNKRNPTFFNLFARRSLPGFIQAIPAIKRRMDFYIMLDKGYDNPCELSYCSGCFMLFPQAVFKQLNGFDDGFFLYLEDADISRRAAQIGRVLFFPDAVITHYWNKGSYKKVFLTWISIKSFFYYSRKWR